MESNIDPAILGIQLRKLGVAMLGNALARGKELSIEEVEWVVSTYDLTFGDKEIKDIVAASKDKRKRNKILREMKEQ